jgi:hypothetical protein
MLASVLKHEENLLEIDRRRREDFLRSKGNCIPTRLEEIVQSGTKDQLSSYCNIINGILADYEMFDEGVTLGREKIIRFKYQREIHVRVLCGMMHAICRGQAALYEPELRAMYGFDDIHQKAHAIMMSRRMGKTMAIVLLCVAFMRNIPSLRALVIANSYKAARLFNEQVSAILKSLGHTKLEPDNSECIGLEFSPNDKRVLLALTGRSTDQLRGQGGDLVILEEAAYVPESTVKQVIVPILRVDKTCVVAISTLGSDDNNYFTRIIKYSLFRPLVISLVCEPCYEAGERDVCSHREHLRPFWHDHKQDSKLKMIIDDEDTYARENLGVMGNKDVDTHAFKTEVIESFLRSPRHPLSTTVRYIFITIDPQPGTGPEDVSRSHSFVVGSIAYPARQLLGMEYLTVAEHADYIDILVRHVERIRRINCCSSAVILLDVASGVQLEATMILDRLRQHVMNIFGTWEVGKKRPVSSGKRSNDREEMLYAAQIALKEGKITISPHFVTVAHRKGPEHLLSILTTELKALERRHKNGKTKVELTGRGEHNTREDGLAMLFLRLARFVEIYQRQGLVIR